jgi:hypothetical protein
LHYALPLIMTRAAVVVVVALLLAPALVGVATPAVQQPNPGDGSRTFSGSWSARGQRQRIPTEGNRFASIVRLSGAVVLAKTDFESGLLGEAIAFDDGQTLSVGRAVWTDARGDRVFSELRGEPVADGRRITGTITGGTGRYAGASGEYTLTWQYVAYDADDVVQGRSVDLRGRLRTATR